jgi:two-component sensor histidine kinase
MTNDLYGLLRITIIGFTASLAILLLVYRRYRIIQQQRELNDAVNELLRRAIVEKEEMLLSKEQLLKEVHHRVKNNLHTVLCLLETQAKCLKDDALAAIETSAHRIYAMLLVHQKLSLAHDVRTIDMATYLQELIGHLEHSFGIKGVINIRLEIAPLQLSLPKAIPIALIVNEAVTNAIKHAFPGNTGGCIVIRMSQRDRTVTIVIHDNGIGIDTFLASIQGGSLGMQLMYGLSEDIDGRLSIENRNGTLITLKTSVSQTEFQNQNILMA